MNINPYFKALGLQHWVSKSSSINQCVSLMMLTDSIVTNDTLPHQLISAMLNTLGLSWSQVNMTCIHTSDLQPLLQTIHDTQPECILAMGNLTANKLLNTTSPLEALRHRMHVFGKNTIPLVATFSPEHLLKTPLDKKEAFKDLQLILSLRNKMAAAS